ncbi:MAG: hypothetical protein P1V20_31855 [Verrucomicrobiales bacterium]|nr:hypothetical protein [Verrucomicrobiales bacterium]
MKQNKFSNVQFAAAGVATLVYIIFLLNWIAIVAGLATAGARIMPLIFLLILSAGTTVTTNILHWTSAISIRNYSRKAYTYSVAYSITSIVSKFLSCILLVGAVILTFTSNDPSEFNTDAANSVILRYSISIIVYSILLIIYPIAALIYIVLNKRDLDGVKE